MDVDVVIDWFITKRIYNLKWALENELPCKQLFMKTMNKTFAHKITEVTDVTQERNGIHFNIPSKLVNLTQLSCKDFLLFHKINMTALSCQWKQSIVDHTISLQNNKSKISFLFINYYYYLI